MIERLRDGAPPSGSPEAELAEAIAAMEPIDTSPARQLRIREALAARPRAHRLPLAALARPALAGALLLVAGAATAATTTAGREWVARGWQRLTGSRPRVAMPVSPALPRAPVAPAPPVAASSEAERPARPRIAPRPAPSAVRVVAHARLSGAEDPAALVGAVRALRSDHDPERAARLLDAYLRAYPHGALAEEALALEVEATAALGSPRAIAFAQQYLRIYPDGRFSQTARQILIDSRD
ncbi:MAG TPA: hypothetical protein VHG72_12955 [Polyangia bacterium]|nr:hypothetical protein [Polyangia bacterium]